MIGSLLVPGPGDLARQLAQDLLTEGPAKGAIAGRDGPSLAAVEALHAALRTEIEVGGILGTPFARAEIAKRGPLEATVAQDFDGMAAKLADRFGQTFSGERPSEPLPKTPGNLVSQ